MQFPLSSSLMPYTTPFDIRIRISDFQSYDLLSKANLYLINWYFKIFVTFIATFFRELTKFMTLRVNY
jgi:hypothetical protein